MHREFADVIQHISETEGGEVAPERIMNEFRQEYLTAKEPIKIISITTLSFDIFIFETLMSLTRGLTLYMTNENEQIKNIYRIKKDP